MTKAAYYIQERASLHRQIELKNLSKEVVKCYVWSIRLCRSETRTFRKIDQKCLENFEMWFWRRMEKIRWTDRTRNEVTIH